MELKHYLNDTIIDEPIGFDSLELKIERGEYHGMSAEVSISNLEFYGIAHDIIEQAYNDDIDTTVNYKVVAIDKSTTSVIYRGCVDLSTCVFQMSEYKSVSARVGEIGPKTTFNNRTDVSVDLETDKTIDKADMDAAQWHSLSIPNKHLLYTDKETQNSDRTIVKSLNYPGDSALRFGPKVVSDPSKGIYQYLIFPMTAIAASEFGQFNQPDGDLLFMDVDSDTMPYQYTPDENHETDYGAGTIANIDFNLKANLIPTTLGTGNIDANVVVTLEAKTPSISIYTLFGKTFTYAYLQQNKNKPIDISLRLQGQLPANEAISYYLRVYVPTPYSIYCNIQILDTSYCKITMYDNLQAKETPTDMILVHDALNVVAHAISENEIGVKSNWYGSPVSQWNRVYQNGGGALKAITNGYKIRDLYSTGTIKRNMPVSFRELIESLNALDCIGWGFESEEDVTSVRVERWNYFYKDDIIISLLNAQSLTKEIDTSKIATEITIGYERYASVDQYNSIDSIHGTRSFTSSIKAVSSKLDKKCAFIADNYAIEETRRSRFNMSETEETSYDENVFIFELIREGSLLVGAENPPELKIGHTATGLTCAGREDELINAKISPRHMAERWRDFIFRANSTSDMKFTSGEINYLAEFGVIPSSSGSPSFMRDSLETFNTTERKKENEDISNDRSILSSEIVSFEYPLTISQYNAIKANPYGLIDYGDGLGWIQEITYKLKEGLASIKLIKKWIRS